MWYPLWMELTHSQYERIAPHLAGPAGQCKDFEPAGVQFRLYVAEHGSKWRGLPARIGNWHASYARMNRWSKNGVLDQVFEFLQREQIVRIKLEAVSMDSTIVKVHPDGTGRQKKGSSIHRPVPRGMDNQRSYGCRGCSDRHHVSRQDQAHDGPEGAQAAESAWSAARQSLFDHGPRVPRRRDSATDIGAGV